MIIDYRFRKNRLEELREAINAARPGDCVVYSARSYTTDNRSRQWDSPVVTVIVNVTPFTDRILHQDDMNLTVRYPNGEVAQLFEIRNRSELWLSEEARKLYRQYRPFRTAGRESLNFGNMFQISFFPAESIQSVLEYIDQMKK